MFMCDVPMFQVAHDTIAIGSNKRHEDGMEPTRTYVNGVINTIHRNQFDFIQFWKTMGLLSAIDMVDDLVTRTIQPCPNLVADDLPQRVKNAYSYVLISIYRGGLQLKMLYEWYQCRRNHDHVWNLEHVKTTDQALEYVKFTIFNMFLIAMGQAA